MCVWMQKWCNYLQILSPLQKLPPVNILERGLCRSWWQKEADSTWKYGAFASIIKHKRIKSSVATKPLKGVKKPDNMAASRPSSRCTMTKRLIMSSWLGERNWWLLNIFMCLSSNKSSTTWWQWMTLLSPSRCVIHQTSLSANNTDFWLSKTWI